MCVGYILTAVGCTNMIPPDNAWLKRADNDIVIGCYMSQQTWQLKCDGHEWNGLVGECAESCEIFVGFLKLLCRCSTAIIGSNLPD